MLVLSTYRYRYDVALEIEISYRDSETGVRLGTFVGSDATAILVWSILADFCGERASEPTSASELVCRHLSPVILHCARLSQTIGFDDHFVHLSAQATLLCIAEQQCMIQKLHHDSSLHRDAANLGTQYQTSDNTC
jgi:hypothetical protein